MESVKLGIDELIPEDHICYLVQRITLEEFIKKWTSATKVILQLLSIWKIYFTYIKFPIIGQLVLVQG